MLGPLLNPADAAYGLVGVYDTSISQLMADSLMVRWFVFIWGGRGVVLHEGRHKTHALAHMYLRMHAHEQ